MKKILFYYAPFISLLIIVSVPLILPYFHKGYFPTHDGEWAVIRLTDMFRTIRDGQFPARFSGYLNNGYGYPLFNFAYPFPYYLGIPFILAKLGFVTTIKLLFAISIPLSAITMFLASRELWKNTTAGIVSAILYIYAPYRIMDLYVRGSLGEALAFVLFPAILWCVIQVANKNNQLFYTTLGGLFLGILIMTHNIMAVLFSIVLVVMMGSLYIIQNRTVLKNYVLLILLGLSISVFFWLPALYEKQYILLSKIPIADRSLYFVSFDKLLFSPWGYGTPTDKDAFTYQIGWAQLAGVIISLGFVLKVFLKRTAKSSYTFFATIFISLFIVLTLLMTKMFSFAWYLPLLSEINYPWTLLSQLTFVASLLAGFVIIQMKDNLKPAVGVFLVSLTIFLVLPNAHPKEYVNRGDEFYITNDATTTSSREYTPLWMKEFPLGRPEKKVESMSAEITDVVYDSKHIVFNTVANSESVVRINTVYYPGWNVFIDGIQTNISYTNQKGVMEVTVPSGSHNIEAKFSETPLRLIANTISLLSVLLLIISLFISSKTNFKLLE